MRWVPVGRGIAMELHERDPEQVMECVRDIMLAWERPDATIPRATRPRAEVWADVDATVDRCVARGHGGAGHHGGAENYGGAGTG